MRRAVNMLNLIMKIKLHASLDQSLGIKCQINEKTKCCLQITTKTNKCH